MMIPCNYEINVAKETVSYTGRKFMRHYCRIELSDCTLENAKEKFRELKAMFPEDKFELTLKYVECKAVMIH